MKFAIVSDIHANLQAWNTVLADAAVQGVGGILCLGDIVGYGPQPAEVLRSVHSKCAAFALGNHDAVICGRLPSDVFNDRAKRSIEWSRRRLGNAAVSFFSSNPLSLVGNGFRCTHGSPADPASFAYVRTPEDAATAFSAVPEQLLFCGHTHVPALFVIGESGIARETSPQDFSLENGKRYLVNVGSVGSPRGAEPCANYVIWDDETKSVFYRSVAFDLESFRASVASASCGVDPLSPGDVPLMGAATGAEVQSVRDETDFSPTPGVRASADDATREMRLEALSRKATRRMRFAAAFASAGCVAVVVAAFFAFRAMRGPGRSFPSWRLPDVSLSETGTPDGNLLPVFSPSREGPFLCVPYRVDLGNASKQSVSSDDMWHIEIVSSDSVRPARVCAPRIECMPGQKIEAFSKVRFSPDFQGAFELTATLLKDDGTEKTLFSRTFQPKPVGIPDSALPTAIRALRSSDGWLVARGTTDTLPAGSAFVKIEVGGHFSGAVTVGAIAARRK